MEAKQLKQSYTIDDIYNLPEGERAELIDGSIYYMAPPSTRHQDISMDLCVIIRNYINSNGGSCKVYHAPFAVFINNDDTNYLEPDISVICDRKKIDDKGCHGAPDWIIEIISPSTKSYDYVTKLSKYMAAGVREYWIVDPDGQSIFVYHLKDAEYKIKSFTFQDKIKVNIWEDLWIDFNEMEHF